MKIKIFSYLVFFIIFFTTSCKKKSNLELFLLDKDKKWVYNNNEKYERNLLNYGFYIEFENDGICHNRSIIDDSPPIDIHDSSGKGNWDYEEKDSCLNVFGHEFKVLKIQKDTISVLRKKDNWKALFVNDVLEIERKRKANR